MLIAVVGAVALSALGGFAGLSWLTMLGAVAAVAAALALYGGTRDRGGPDGQSGIAVPTAPVTPNYKRYRLTDVSLPSNREGFRFLLSATVLWAPLGPYTGRPDHDSAEIAAGAIVRRASALTGQQDPTYAPTTERVMTLALSETVEETPQRILVKAEEVRLTVSDEDKTLLAKFARAFKDDVVWEYARQHEPSQRAYLTEDALKDPPSAVAWWLARHPDADMREAAGTIPYLAQISHAVNGLSSTSLDGTTESSKSPVDHLVCFLQTADVTEENRILMARRLARISEVHGLYDIADEVMRHFGVPGGNAPGSLYDDMDDGLNNVDD